MNGGFRYFSSMEKFALYFMVQMTPEGSSYLHCHSVECKCQNIVIINCHCAADSCHYLFYLVNTKNVVQVEQNAESILNAHYQNHLEV